MPFPANKRGEVDKEEAWGLLWPKVQTPLSRHFYCIQQGGQWKGSQGQKIGGGLEFHFTEAAKIIWPTVVFHRWVTMFIKEFLTKRTVVVIGGASTGKTLMAAFCVLLDYYCFPTQTTVICCSTTRERLEDRVWGQIKALHKSAVNRFNTLPGYLIESRQRIITNDNDQWIDGRDFRNGLVGVPCLQGGSFVGISNFVGLKNKRVTLVGDELSMLPKAFVDSISNLDKNPKFLCIGLGNPKDITDALGILAEPTAEAGGWDGGIDQQPYSKVWDTRRKDGSCLQLICNDSPNLDGKLGIPLITQEQIDRDVSTYGKDSLQYTMMNLGAMPRGQGSRRVITRQECEKFGARLEPAWANTARTYIASLDAAYGGVGGDRCILCFCEFGEEMPPLITHGELNGSALVNQPKPDHQKRHLFALKEMMLVPIKNEKDADTPTNQIALFCKQQCELRNIPPANFFYDAGMRTALTQAMSRLWSVHVNTIDFGGKPSERNVSSDIDVKCCDYYSKFVTELWYSVRFIIMGGQFRGLDEETMMEFAAREWMMVRANKTEVEPKAETKKKTGRSPDRADALAIAVEGARQKGFVIRRLRPAEEPEEDSRWKDQARDLHKKFWRSGALLEPAA
jgi:hypothetical protein